MWHVGRPEEKLTCPLPPKYVPSGSRDQLNHGWLPHKASNDSFRLVFSISDCHNAFKTVIGLDDPFLIGVFSDYAENRLKPRAVHVKPPSSYSNKAPHCVGNCSMIALFHKNYRLHVTRVCKW